MTSENGPKYWMSPSELEPRDDSQVPPENERETGEFARRTFLKATGFTAMGAFLAACSPGPVRKAIPFLIPPEEITPGRAYFYASTCGGCSAGCGLMAKNRDGRPIKLEGFRSSAAPVQRSHPVSQGGLCAAGQAGLLGLYDSKRIPGPLKHNSRSDWKTVDQEIEAQLKGAKGDIVLLTSTVTSPTTLARIAELKSRFKNFRHVQYDALSCSALLDAQEATFGVRVLPRFHFEKADVIVSFDADFLGTWISPVEFSAGYASGREVNAQSRSMSWHGHVESSMSLTGSKADRRFVANSSESFEILKGVAQRVAARTGHKVPAAWSKTGVRRDAAELIADRLLKHRGRSLVVSGSNDLAEQVLVAFINQALGNYGSTLDLARPSYQKQGRDEDFAHLVADMKAGKVSVLMTQGVNPVYDRPEGTDFAAALKKVACFVAVSGFRTETSDLAHYVCPEPHFLEAWDDAVPVHGVLTMTQPAINPLFDVRHLRESLAVWAGTGGDDRSFRRSVLKKEIFSGAPVLENAWKKALHDGVYTFNQAPLSAKWNGRPLEALNWKARASEGMEVVFYADTGMWDGRFGHNAWLQELPDPITKISWGNAALLAPGAAASRGLKDGDVIEISCQNKALRLPVRIQPGQHENVVAVALGYGRAGTDRFARVGPQWLEGELTVVEGGAIGVNVAPAQALDGGRVQRSCPGTIKATGQHVELSMAQTWHSLDLPKNTAPHGFEHRDVVQETTIAALAAGHSGHEHHGKHDVDLWDNDHDNDLPHWGMSIDLTRCTGCSACVVSCQVENNIPVVGRDEVKRRREMHWLRIDRYFNGPIEMPEKINVVYQPMMCQQCDNAPCESVCPVLATVHSEEGLNQQVYNRCIGTRYCANDCPYKVRRFNWFDYSREDQLQNMALNPDVVTRSRGVMEKCSFCVQRIQAAKSEAKRRGVPLADGDIEPACMQTCPTNAIVFGNMKDPASRVSKTMADPLEFRVLEELNVKPTVSYRKVVRNRDEKGGHHG